MKLQYVMVSHPFYHFLQTSLLINNHCNKSLVWFKASGFYYTINPESSLGLLSCCSLVSWRSAGLTPSCVLIDEVDAVWNNQALGGSWPGQPSSALVPAGQQQPGFAHIREGASSPVLKPQALEKAHFLPLPHHHPGLDLLCWSGKVQGQLS